MTIEEKNVVISASKSEIDNNNVLKSWEYEVSTYSDFYNKLQIIRTECKNKNNVQNSN